MTNKGEFTILVPTDFTEVGDNAIAHGIEFSKIFKNKLLLLHVVDANTKKHFKVSDSELVKATKEKLTELKNNLLETHEIEIDIIAKEGNIFETINQIAEEVNARIVVMGTHGKKGIQHIVGSYALKVISQSQVPYVVVQKKPPIKEGYKNIILPMDVSREAKQKVLWAIYLGKLFRSNIHILVAHETDPFLSRKVKNNLVYTKRQFEKNEVSYEIHISDKSSNTLDKHALKFAKDVNAGLIIIMTTKQYGIDDYIIGPGEQRIITNSDELPVMCVNPRQLYVDATSMKG